jgi:hypothetical protein
MAASVSGLAPAAPGISAAACACACAAACCCACIIIITSRLAPGATAAGALAPGCSSCWCSSLSAISCSALCISGPLGCAPPLCSIAATRLTAGMPGCSGGDGGVPCRALELLLRLLLSREGRGGRPGPSCCAATKGMTTPAVTARPDRYDA